MQGQGTRSNDVPPRPQPPRGVSRVEARPQEVQRQGVPTALVLPLNFLSFSIELFSKILGFGGSLVHSIAQKVLPRRVIRFFGNVLNRILGSSRGVDPTTAATDFIRNFNTKYGERCPRWQICGWEEAASRAQSEGRFLFVYLHAAHHQHTDTFCKETLCAPAFVDYLNSTFVAWGGDLRYRDAYWLNSSLRVSSYPYCALLAFSGSRTRLICSVQGLVRPDALAETLQRALLEHGGLLWEEQLVQEQRENDRRLREEQDAEYQRSLEADMAKEAERRAREEAELQAQKEIEEQERIKLEQSIELERREKERADAISKRREKRLASLDEEPALGDDAVIIRLRFPSGETHQRCFLKSQMLEDVFCWVESLESTVFLDFDLATTFPRRVLSKSVATSTLNDLEFTGQMALVVQPKDD